MNYLSNIPIDTEAAIKKIRGSRSFRCRLMELGMIHNEKILLIRRVGHLHQVLVRNSLFAITEANEIQVSIL